MPIALLFVLAASATWAPARSDEASRVDLPGESANTARRLAAADKLAARKQVTEAIEEYDRILTEAGDDLVPLSPGHCVQARWLCHLRLAALSGADLRLYRQRADARAKKWFEEGKSKRDSRLLRRVVDEAFCSRHGDKALDLLGDLAFERGRFDEAERWWRLLTPPASLAARPRPKGKEEPLILENLAFPDPQVDVSRTRAKQLLARIFRGEAPGRRLQQDIKAFRAQHPKAEGRFAGRTGNLGDILQAILDARAKAGAAESQSSWPTFAGALSRSFLATETARRLQRLCARPPRWRFDLESHERLEKGEGKPPARVMTIPALNRALAFHPAIVDDQVLVADARSVTAYDLRTGDCSVWYDVTKEKDGLDHLLNLKLPAPADLRYTLTVADDCLFARVGVQELSADHEARENLSFLVCLRLRPGEKEERLRWQVAPGEPNSAAVFEGAPVVRDGRAYIAATRVEKGQTITAILCYPVRTDDTPRPLWRKDICSSQELGPKVHRYRHHLLTLAGPRLVYCSHAGAIVALDTDTGRRAWAVRYPQRGSAALLSGTGDSNGAPRDLVPCVYAAGRIYAAPADSDRILCLDSDTGRIIWDKGPIEVVHLLGVARERLIFTTLTGIHAVDATSGSGQRGWRMPDTEGLAPVGRGFLAEGMVFWPTARGLRVLDIEDGQQRAEFVPGVLPAARAKKLVGNMVYADGYLAVAGTRELQLYVADAHQHDERQRQAKAAPDSAAAHYQLALAEADAGLSDRALASFQRAQQLAKDGKSPGPLPISQASRAGRHEVLLEQAHRAALANRWEDAADCLRRAAAEEFAVADRLRALARQGSLWLEAGQLARAVAAWQSILADDTLRRARMNDTDGNAQSAATLASVQIDAVIRAHGPQAYEAVEKQARQRLTSINDQDRIKGLQQLAAEFPNATVIGPVLVELARTNEKARKYGAAAYDYRALLRRGGNDADRAAVLARLAHAYEQECCWAAARTTWEQLARLGGDSIIPAVDSERPVRAFVTRELEKPAYAVLRKAAIPSAAAPLLRAWETDLESEGRLLAPDGMQAGNISNQVLFFGARVAAESGKRGLLVCRAADTGRKRWDCPLPFAPEWTGSHADTIVVSGQRGVWCVRLDDGLPLWEFPASAALSAFRLASAGLFFMEGGRRLLALDPETGRVLWSRWAPGARLGLSPPAGCFSADYYAGEERLLVHTSGGRRWLLDARTGRILADVESSRPASGPPLILDGGRACLVTDARHVVQLDLADGKETWTYELGRTASLTGEPPQLLTNRKSLFILIPRNFGSSLQCLDPRTGSPRWDEERLLTTDAVAADQVSCDQTGLYFVAGNVLYAHGLKDGKPLWEHPLIGPIGRWRTVATPDSVLAYPLDRRKPRVGFGSIFESVEWTTVDHSLHVDVCDLKSGQLEQRLNVASNGQTWGDQPVVLLTGQKLIVSAGGKVVVLK
jgi:outer membrane protein assembly factor BamB